MILTINEITKSYRNPGGTATRTVLNRLNLEVSPHEMIAITGPSGSGKTTLLNIAGTLDLPDSGEVIFNGTPLHTQSANQLAAIRNKEIGFVFQMHHLFPQLTALENILLPTLALKKKQGNSQSQALQLMKELGINPLRNQKPGELSGGECQRVAVARALINQPSLLLADEPTGSLDRSNALELVRLLKKINHTYGTTLLMVTHAKELTEEMNHVYALTDGKLTEIGQ